MIGYCGTGVTRSQSIGLAVTGSTGIGCLVCEHKHPYLQLRHYDA